jgi:hypothetical protein
MRKRRIPRCLHAYGALLEMDCRKYARRMLLWSPSRADGRLAARKREDKRNCSRPSFIRPSYQNQSAQPTKQYNAPAVNDTIFSRGPAADDIFTRRSKAANNCRRFLPMCVAADILGGEGWRLQQTFFHMSAPPHLPNFNFWFFVQPVHSILRRRGPFFKFFLH